MIADITAMFIDGLEFAFEEVQGKIWTAIGGVALIQLCAFTLTQFINRWLGRMFDTGGSGGSHGHGDF